MKRPSGHVFTHVRAQISEPKTQFQSLFSEVEAVTANLCGVVLDYFFLLKAQRGGELSPSFSVYISDDPLRSSLHMLPGAKNANKEVTVQR